ncbi:cytochrome P450 [Cantharellus anzutake]|uniref:cytochrome P450 n=1 Tax=Cantharellus anzutake TaxID=1750568 RepID=UPI001903CF4C|nr:cytochrome P450 [Cantharellus anzutake]KAF8325803.1 cytochrome P450 [Cantharellus anzutake]
MSLTYPFAAHLYQALGVLLIVCIAFVLTRSRQRYPPGPPGDFFFGHLFEFKTGGPRFSQLRAWHEKYGPLFTLRMGWNFPLFVIGGDGELVRELLDKRGAIYSQRPLMYRHLLMDKFESPLWERNWARWRMNRRLLVQRFRPMTAASTQEHQIPVIEAESTQLLNDLLSEPEQLTEHPMRFASSVMTSLVYGIRGPKYDCFSVSATYKIMTNAILFTMPPLDKLSILRLLPDFLWPWRKSFSALADLRDTLHEDLAHRSKDRFQQGLNPETLAEDLWSSQEKLDLSDRRIHRLLGLAHEGGADPVAFAILSGIMALVNHPRVMRKAQEEIDSVCDEGTMPQWSDYDRLPYVRMIIKETFRWRPPFPWGVVHELSENDEWGGYHLPKGSTVILNIWEIHMNPRRYANPEEFIPERFEEFPLPTTDYVSSPDYMSRDVYTFGAGRRVCPGSHIAEMDLFLALSKIIWAFDLATPDGKPLNADPVTAFKGHNLREPVPFKVNFTPRGEVRRSIIARELATAEEIIFSRFGCSPESR